MVERPITPQVKAQPYSEEEATRWLAWLAARMRQHDKAVFQIETIQPSWLVGSNERVFYLRLTRILWGILTVVIVGLILLLFVGLNFLLSGSLIGDLSVEQVEEWSSDLIFWLIFWLIFSLIFWPIFWLIGKVRGTSRPFGQEIQTIESLQWSWNNVSGAALNGFSIGLRVGLIGGLVIGLGVGLIGGLSGGPVGELIDGLRVVLRGGLSGGLSVGVIYGLIYGLNDAFQPSPYELKTRPNQGMWLTLQSALKVGTPVGLVLGLLAGWLSSSLTAGFLFSLPAFAAVALWYGGLDVLEHGIIRLTLWRRGHAPLNYAKFLDYAADELNFLQKVGGGYVFIHRYLLEHFAEIAVERGYVEETTTNSDGN